MSRSITAFEDRGEVRLIGRVDAIDHRFEVAGDHAEGRPSSWLTSLSSVRPLVLVALEPLDHRVECAAELADRTPARDGKLTRVV